MVRQLFEGGSQMHPKLLLLLTAVSVFACRDMFLWSRAAYILRSPNTPTMLADGGDPPPDECGLFDICRATNTPTMVPDDGTVPPPDEFRHPARPQSWQMMVSLSVLMVEPDPCPHRIGCWLAGARGIAKSLDTV
jgi:hypothetical protein